MVTGHWLLGGAVFRNLVRGTILARTVTDWVALGNRSPETWAR